MIAHNITLIASGNSTATSWKQQILVRLIRMRYQLIGGFFVGVFLPFVFRGPEAFGVNFQYYQTSAVGCFVALLMGFVILRKTTSLPGSAALINILPAFILSYGFVLMIFFGLRLEYNRYFFLASFLLTSAWFFVVIVAILRSSRPAFGVIHCGKIDELTSYRNIDTIQIESVEDAKRFPNLPLVIDFQSESLTDDWERYLAEQTIQGRTVFNAQDLLESLEGKIELESFSKSGLGEVPIDQIYRPAKRYVDAVAALLAIAALMPFLFLIGLYIRFDSPGPALFKQARIGFRGKTFTVYKFRSMRIQDDKETSLSTDMTQSDDHRITKVGAIIRKLRIDELPQLINVVRGEMSWIGPRPETLRLSRWYESEIPYYRIRHVVRPGITGWAQVRQGHVTSVDDVREKLAFDLFYVKNFSLWLDVLIVIHTIRVVLTGNGAK